MKKTGLQISLLAFMLVGACNKEDYFGKKVAVEGLDAACSAGTDVASCEAISGCQVAYEDVESVTPVFAACISNPPPAQEPPVPSSNPESPPSENSSDVTIDDAYKDNCENVKPSCTHVKNYSDDQGHSMRVKKIKICHQTSNGEHAIIVACPALKGHRKHDDYLGACKVD